MERLPGFRDFYPEPLPDRDAWSADLRQHIFAAWRNTARHYGFREYDGPPLEPLDLYTVKSGAEIVGQLYHFTDKGGRDVALRPEMTPTLARMAAAHDRHYRKPPEVVRHPPTLPLRTSAEGPPPRALPVQRRPHR
ncbi:MAG: ATP phosphoribosyltransferase regulatory subunit [Verrucomicrobia bacterium]|nr:ATP phosphoribosyltransferase regulatory subunit [Verrucomicrobiota bacterium]